MIILVDMDGVIADFEQQFLVWWQQYYPHKKNFPLVERTTWNITEQYPSKYKDLINSIQDAPGFFLSMPLIPGAKKALQEMENRAFKVFLCSSPRKSFENCVFEKYKWIELNLGTNWVERLILTRDKTLIQADFLIDDRPEIDGVNKSPSWEHIIYEQPYNQLEQGKRRLTWDNWENAILPNI